MYAIIETGGKQFKVAEGDLITVEKLNVDDDSEFVFDKVLALSTDAGLNVGKPYLDAVKVKATVIKTGKAKKVTVFRYKAKKGYRKKKGHRQPFTQLKIEKIEA